MGLMPVVVAVDGGGSKTDAIALTLDGEIIGRGMGAGCVPHFLGVDGSLAVVEAAIVQAVGPTEVVRAGLYLSGLDFEFEIADYRAQASLRSWARSGLDVDNDLFALLRSGTDEPDAVAVVCGTGINAVGIRSDGATARFTAIGQLSGDWGGGGGLGAEAFWHAARDADGRGPRTQLRPAIEEFWGHPIAELIVEFHRRERDPDQLSTLAPLLLASSRAGDPVAMALVDRQAEEIVALARASMNRLGLGNHPLPVVLGGGLIQSGDARLLHGIELGLSQVAPDARMVLVNRPPILGAALLTLVAAGAGAAALSRVRADLA